MRELESYRKGLRTLPQGALDAEIQVEAEVQAEKEEILSVAVSGGKPAGASASDQTALFVRVSGEKTGMAYTQKLHEDPAAVLQRAFDNSHYSQAAGREPMNGPGNANAASMEDTDRTSAIAGGLDNSVGTARDAMIPVNGTEGTCRINAEELKQRVAELEKALVNEAGDVTFSMVTLTETIRTFGVVNTLGCDKTYSRANYEAQAMLSQENGLGHHLLDVLQSSPRLDGITAEYFLRRLAHWKSLQLPPCACAPGTYRTVLDASVMCNIFATAWQLFSAPFYLTKNTPLAGKIGEQLFSNAITMRDIPVLDGSGYQFPFDCEGSEGTAAELVQAGRFTGLLQTLASARTMGLPTTGNAGRKTLMSGNVHTQVAAMPKNFLLAPGNETLDSLLSSLPDGLYIHESYDVFHSVNIASGSFTIPCKGIVIRDGKPTGVASGLTMNGNVCDLLAAVEKAANDVQLLPMHMLKSYAVAAPSVLVSNLQISGESA